MRSIGKIYRGVEMEIRFLVDGHLLPIDKKVPMVTIDPLTPGEASEVISIKEVSSTRLLVDVKYSLK